MEDYKLSTSDNPFSPRTEWDSWRQWDTIHGYNTLELLSRFWYQSDNLSEYENDLAYDLAIETIINEVPTGTDAIWVLV